MIEFTSTPEFDQTAVAEAKKIGVALHEIFTCNDLNVLKRTNITKHEFPELFTTIDNTSQEPKKQKKRNKKSIKGCSLDDSFMGKAKYSKKPKRAPLLKDNWKTLNQNSTEKPNVNPK